MPEQTKMTAYAVSLNFRDGPLVCNLTVAASPEAAVAGVTAQAIQQMQITQPLEGVVVVPISADWLDYAVRAVKGKLPQGAPSDAQVLQLVPKLPCPWTAQPDPPEPQAGSIIEGWRKRHCPSTAQEPDPPEPPVDWPAA